MNFKRGICMGILLIAYTTGEIIRMACMGSNKFWWLYLIAFLLGIIQLASSFQYRKSLKRRVLMVVFALESVYFMIASGYLLVCDTTTGIKIFGELIGVFWLGFTFSSIYALRCEACISCEK